MPDSPSLDEVVDTDVVPLPTDAECIKMKLLASADRLPDRLNKAVKDFDDAMYLATLLDKQGGEMSYKDDTEKKVVEAAFNSFYPKYKAVKEEQEAFYWTEEEWKAYLKFD